MLVLQSWCERPLCSTKLSWRWEIECHFLTVMEDWDLQSAPQALPLLPPWFLVWRWENRKMSVRFNIIWILLLRTMKSRLVCAKETTCQKARQIFCSVLWAHVCVEVPQLFCSTIPWKLQPDFIPTLWRKFKKFYCQRVTWMKNKGTFDDEKTDIRIPLPEWLLVVFMGFHNEATTYSTIITEQKASIFCSNFRISLARRHLLPHH